MDIINEIIQSVIGTNNANKPNAAITISLDRYPIDGGKPKNVLAHSSYKAVIDIKKIKNYMMVDLSFPSYLDNDLKLAWRDLEVYGEELNNVSNDTTEIPFLILTLTPISVNAAYFISCTTPIFWTLQPQKPGGQNNTIRILFDAEDFGFFETNEINEEEIDAEVNRMIAEQDIQRAALEQKEQDKIAFEEERKNMMEEFKRNE